MLYPIENRVREVKSLDGIWKFKIDRENQGIAENWQERPLENTIPMAVPASYNDLLTEEADKSHVGYVWYERNFVIPAGWEGRRIVLRFGSAAHHAVCWLDGQEITRHKGGFLPFEADITDALEAGQGADASVEQEHRLTVALSNILDWTCIPCGEIVTKEGEDYPEGYHYQDTFFDFYNYTGIHRPVKLYTTPRRYIGDIVVTTAQNADHTQAEVTCEITGTDTLRRVMVLDEDGRVTAQVSVDDDIEVPACGGDDAEVPACGRDDAEVPACGRDDAEVPACGGDDIEVPACGSGEGPVRTWHLTLTVDAPHLWKPGKAYLYRLRVEGDEDIYTESFGIRSVEVTDKAFLINGEPFYFRGFGKHEDSDVRGKGLDEALNIRDFNLMKWMGANSFRTSHYPYSEELMMLADREGFVLIDEVPAVGMCFWKEKKVFDGERVNDGTLKHHLDMLRDMYQRDKNHPCVVMWSVGNEADTSEDGAVPYFKKVIDTMHNLDDTRPVTLVQTIGPSEDKVSQWLDVICVNRYFGWYSDHGHLEVIGLQLEKELKEWYEKYHKLLIMTEYGADTIAGLHKLPPVTFSEEFQCAFLNEYHKIFDKLDFMIGEHVWAFADFQTKQATHRVDGNKKGVFTRNRQPKMAAYVLRERWLGCMPKNPL